MKEVAWHRPAATDFTFVFVVEYDGALGRLRQDVTLEVIVGYTVRCCLRTWGAAVIATSTMFEDLSSSPGIHIIKAD